MSEQGYRGVDPGGVDGWSNYEKLVMSRLTSLEQNLNAMREELVLVRVDVATLKVKSGVWGAAAGLIPAAITLAFVVLSSSGGA